MNAWYFIFAIFVFVSLSFVILSVSDKIIHRKTITITTYSPQRIIDKEALCSGDFDNKLEEYGLTKEGC